MTGSDVDWLLSQLAAGDEKAFETLYARCADRLFWAALRMLNHREDAEDAVQQVFASFIRARVRMTEVRDLDAYLFASVRRAAQKMIARARRQPLANTDQAADIAMAPEDRPGDSTRNERLQRCVSTLPPRQREVIALKIDGQLTFAQIGELLGVSPNTAASRYRLALEKLRTKLESRTHE